MILLWLGIKPHTPADHEQLALALQHLMADDPALAVRSGADATVLLGAPDEDRLEGVVHQLVRRFGVEAAVRELTVAYKETVTRAADGESKYAVQSDGHGQYAHVKIRVEPGEPGSGCVFENTVIGGAIPERMIRSVEEGIDEGIDRGVVAGYPMDDIRVSVYDGSYHDVDSSEAAFKIAGRLAFIEAARRAKPILIEPIMIVSVETPPDFRVRVMDALRARSGFSIIWRGVQRASVEIFALVPLSHMFGFDAELNERTGRQGTFTMTFARYAPAILRQDDGDRAADVTAPLRPRTPPLILRAAVPEPRD